MAPLRQREGELELIAELIEQAGARDGRLGLVQGPPGVGKTALLGAAREIAAERGALVLTARGLEIEREYSFGFARQLLAREASRSPDRLAGAAGLAAPALGLRGDGPGPAPGQMHASLHGLHWLVEGLAETRTVVLLADDVHWADDESLRFLAYLANRLDGLAVAILAGMRTGRASEGRPALGPLAADPRAARLQPEPLGRDAVAAVIRDELGADPEPPFADAVTEASGGNPFFLSELLRDLGARGVAPTAAASEAVGALGPESISRVLQRRIDGAPPGAGDLAVAVAVLGRDDDRRYAAALAELEDDHAASCADALVDAGVFASGLALDFVHPIARRAIYGSIPPGRRAQTHARAARVLHERGAPVEAVAAQLLQAPPAGSEWAVSRLREAAAIAGDRGAPATAAALLRRALDERAPDSAPAALLAELGRQQALAGDLAAVASFKAAAAAEDDADRRAEVALALARLQFILGQLDESRAMLVREAAAHAGGSRELRLHLAAEVLAIDRMLPGEPPPVPAPLVFDQDALTGASAGERAVLVGRALEVVMQLGPIGTAVDLATRTLSDGRLLQEEGVASPTYLNAVLVLLLADELEAADGWLARAEEETRRRGDFASYVALAAFGSATALRRGRVLAALELARESAAGVAESGSPVLAGVVATFAIDAMVEAGALDEADGMLASLGLDGDLPQLFHLAAVLSRRGRLRCEHGRLEDGLAELLDAGERLVRGRSLNPAFSRWRSDAARALGSLGRTDEALGLAREELALARAVGQPSSIGVALRAVGRADHDAAETLLEEAASVLADSPDRLQEAHALTDLGAALRVAGRRVDAREPLRRGLELAERCGAPLLCRRAREELLAAGARPRRTALSGVESLTPSEARCARLAATGRTNREIAQDLFVSLRAVEMHLSSAYRKLGIRSRRELGSLVGLADGGELGAAEG